MSEIKIIKTSGNLDEYNTYDLTESPSIESLKTLENHDIIEVSKWMIYENEGQEILSMQDDLTGMCYSGQSKSFREGFESILERISKIGIEQPSIYLEIIKRRSKAGRDYLLCALVSPEKAAKRFDTPFPETAMPEPEK